MTRTPERIRRLLNNAKFDRILRAKYEHRLVAFYDVLGWRSKISWAGQDEERIALLLNLVSRLHHLSDAIKKGSSNISNMTTFSDNVVISQKVDNDTTHFLTKVAMAQILAADSGFWIRGGVTIGEVIHNDKVVFGPGLNRAYELETRVALYPRIVLDPQHVHKLVQDARLISVEDGTTFLDPFSPRFFDYLHDSVGDLISWFVGEVTFGLGAPKELLHLAKLNKILHVLDLELQGPLEDKEQAKLNWLRGHIRKNLEGQPTLGQLMHSIIT